MQDSETRARDVLEDQYFGKPVRARIREFGFVFSVFCLFIAAVRLYRGSSLTFTAILLVMACAFAALGIAKPRVLYWPWRGWMGLAHVLSFVMGPIVMAAAWTIVLVPVALLLRIIGKKVMDLRFRADVETYWEERSAAQNDFRLLERQF